MTNIKKGSVRWALNRGLKLGFIGGGDDHYIHPGTPIKQNDMKNLAPVLKYKPGIAAILSEELSSQALIENLNNRNCYATTGKRLWIKIQEYSSSAMMGQEVEISESPILVITVCETRRIEEVELIKNGSVIAVRVPGSDRIKFAYRDIELERGEEAYYYVRVTQFNGE
ncbi:MAG: hypothetical protein GF329_05335 [Candidatus Lokiarchaeota archaeon]|nr:hypothetical protein [Candidatus Lokiarchaeota archaeon]